MQGQPQKQKKTEFEKNPAVIDKILASGASTAEKIAQKTMAQVRKAMGLI